MSFSAVHPCFSFDNATDKTDNDGESSNSQDLERNGEEQRNQENSEIRKPEDIERMLSDDETLNKRLLSLRGSLKRKGSGSRVSRLVDSFKLTLVKFKESCHLSLKKTKIMALIIAIDKYLITFYFETFYQALAL